MILYGKHNITEQQLVELIEYVSIDNLKQIV